MHIGCGLDIHPLKKGEKLILGGVEIPFEKGAVGHSDADCLSHAIVDALLGAAGLGDIGKLFPSSEEKYKDASSLDFLVQVKKLLNENHWAIVNIDATVSLESPKISSWTIQIKENLSQALSVKPMQVHVKGTTCDGLGFIGRGEGLAVWAVALLERTG